MSQSVKPNLIGTVCLVSRAFWGIYTNGVQCAVESAQLLRPLRAEIMRRWTYRRLCCKRRLFVVADSCWGNGIALSAWGWKWRGNREGGLWELRVGRVMCCGVFQWLQALQCVTVWVEAVVSDWVSLHVRLQLQDPCRCNRKQWYSSHGLLGCSVITAIYTVAALAL